MKCPPRIGKLVISIAALTVACSLQGGLTTDLGENETEAGSGGSGGAGPSGTAKGGAGQGGNTGTARGGSARSGGESIGGSKVSGPIPIPQGGSPAEPSGEAGAGGSVSGFAELKNEYGFAFADSFFITGCGEVQGHECLNLVNEPCPNVDAANFEDKGERFEERFTMGGELGEVYLVTISVNGIVEGKYYSGGTRRAGNDFVNDATDNDLLHVGGAPIPSIYRVYKLSVFQPDGSTEWQHYYLNSATPSSAAESHRTFPISYQVTIEVPGQGVIALLNQDANCRAINNCGPGDNGVNCPAARNVPNEPGLAIPAMHGGRSVAEMNNVSGATQPYHAQIIHVRVLSVTLKQ